MTLRSFIWQYIHQTLDMFGENGGLIQGLGKGISDGSLTPKQATELLKADGKRGWRFW